MGLLAALGLAATPALATADALVLDNSVLYGTVVSVEAQSVQFVDGCTGAPRAFPKAQVKGIEYGGGCKPRQIAPYSAGVEVCGRPRAAYQVVLRGRAAALEVSDVSASNGRVHVLSLDETQYAHGPLSAVLAVRRDMVCLDAGAPSLKPPAPFCVEARQWAVNFGPEPAFRNRILTRGVPFALESDAGQVLPPDDPRGVLVREAFGAAVTHWIGALQDHRADLTPEAEAVLNGMISRGSRYQLLTPPQIVQVGCRDTATFVVRFVERDARNMVVGGRIKAARAEVMGRTIWINGVDYPCWRADLRDKLLLDELAPNGQPCANLVPIMIHEIGHALGLSGHMNVLGRRSVMDTQPSSNWPTEPDVRDLVSVLVTPVEGAPAGRLDADAQGVELPAAAGAPIGARHRR